MSRPNPVLKINSLQDLADRPDMKVYAANDSTLFAFATEENDELAIAIRKMIVSFNAEDILDREFRHQLIDNLRAGTHSFSFYRMTALFQIIRLMNDLSYDDDEYLSDILHLSIESGGFLPSALAYYNKQEYIHNGLNQM